MPEKSIKISRIQVIAFKNDDHSTIVALEISKLAGVIQQPVAVAKVDMLRDLKQACVAF